MTKLTSPMGEFKYAFITGNGRESLSGVDQYSIMLVLSPKEAQPLIDIINKVWADSGIKKQPKSFGYKTDEETGNINFNFKTNVNGKNGKKTIPIFDAKGVKVDLGSKLMGNGSTGRVQGAAATYEAGPSAGVTLYLNAVQITSFIEYEGGSGFDAVEGADFTGFKSEFDISELEPETKPAIPSF